MALHKKYLTRWIIFLITIIGYRHYWIHGKYGIRAQQKQQQIITQEKMVIAKLEQERDRLKKEIDLLRHDSFYQEKIAREVLLLGKPDELVYFLPKM